MKIGIIGAIKDEIKIFKDIIYPYTTKNVQYYNIDIGIFNKHNIFLINSGIGKVSATISVMILIQLYKPDIIINTGSAGSLTSLCNIGDIILPQKVYYYDVDLTNFGYSYGQIPKYPKKFAINQIINPLLKEKTFNNTFIFKRGDIITGDKFIRNNFHTNILQKKFPSAIAIDMESTAIAQVCYKFNIPLIIVRSISDLSDKNATRNFKKNISIACLNSFKCIKYILKNLI